MFEKWSKSYEIKKNEIMEAYNIEWKPHTKFDNATCIGCLYLMYVV